MIFLFSFNEYGVSEWSYIDNCENLFCLQSCIPGAVTSLVSPRCHAYAFISNSDRFVLSPWLIISLAPCRERGPADTQLVSRVAGVFLSLRVFGLREPSRTPRAPYGRRVSTSLRATWRARSFLFHPGEVWAENAEFKVLVFPLRVYRVLRFFWKSIVGIIKEKDQVASLSLSPFVTWG